MKRGRLLRPFRNPSGESPGPILQTVELAASFLSISIIVTGLLSAMIVLTAQAVAKRESSGMVFWTTPTVSRSSPSLAGHGNPRLSWELEDMESW
jgi:hypothetical protein